LACKPCAGHAALNAEILTGRTIGVPAPQTRSFPCWKDINPSSRLAHSISPRGELISAAAGVRV